MAEIKEDAQLDKLQQAKKQLEELERQKKDLEKTKERIQQSQLSGVDRETRLSADRLGAGLSVDCRVLQLQEADLKQKIAKGISDAAAEANKQFNEGLSAMLQPIYDVIQSFKSVPDKLRSLVDTQGAAAGIYGMMSPAGVYSTMLSAGATSSEVPITLDDYYADPQRYGNLMAIEFQKNGLTEDDCLSSGYTKVKWELSEEQVMPPAVDASEFFQSVQNRDIVAKQMEKLVNTTIKTTWQAAQPPINVIAGIANIGPIPGMIQSVVDAVDGIVKIASKSIPEKKLDEMLAQKKFAQEKAAAETEKAKMPDSGAADGEESRIQKALASAENAISQAYDGASAGIKESFANFQAPSIPDDIKETIEDFKDAISMVKDNIMNIYTVVLLKMMGAVFKCFNQILGVIGVPSIPDPLGKIPQVIADAQKVMEFIMGLPVSLVQCLTAIIKRKIKAVMVAQMPAPPLPLPEKTPVPPTSKDVVRPETDWDDVKAVLTDKYKFSGGDADEIISKLQAFYDGSGEDAIMVVGQRLPERKIDGTAVFDSLPIYESRFRYKMTPLYCKNTWIENSIEIHENLTSDTVYYYLNPPVKCSEFDVMKTLFFTTDKHQKTTPVEFPDNAWTVLKSYSSGPGKL